MATGWRWTRARRRRRPTWPERGTRTRNAPLSAEPAVLVEGLWEAYRVRGTRGWRRRGEPRWALSDVDLSIEAGASLGVIGGNGSGKTTLLQVLAGVLQPTRGTVTVRGRVSSLVDLSAGFHRDLSGHENVLIGGVLLGLSRRQVRDRYDEIVAFSGLSADALASPLLGYSAGMGLRLGFALVVHADPDVLLVDEVLAVGDEAFQQRCLERVDDLGRHGCAVVIVSHDLDVVRARCDRVAVLEQGRLIHSGAPEEAVTYYLGRGDAPDGPAADRRLYEVYGRAKAVQRRKGS